MIRSFTREKTSVVGPSGPGLTQALLFQERMQLGWDHSKSFPMKLVETKCGLETRMNINKTEPDRNPRKKVLDSVFNSEIYKYLSSAKCRSKHLQEGLGLWYAFKRYASQAGKSHKQSIS